MHRGSIAAIQEIDTIPTQFPDVSSLVRHICRSRFGLSGCSTKVFDVIESHLANLARSQEIKKTECEKGGAGGIWALQSSERSAREKEKPRWTLRPAGLIEVQKHVFATLKFGGGGGN